VVHGHRPSDRPAAFAGLEPLERIGLLVEEETSALAPAHHGVGDGTAAGSTDCQPTDGCMVNAIALGDGPETFAGFEPGHGFTLLMVVELGFAAEPGAALDGGDA
jgi:hypothetical protein